jgi:hypothetical protein
MRQKTSLNKNIFLGLMFMISLINLAEKKYFYLATCCGEI